MKLLPVDGACKCFGDMPSVQVDERRFFQQDPFYMPADTWTFAHELSERQAVCTRLCETEKRCVFTNTSPQLAL